MKKFAALVLALTQMTIILFQAQAEKQPLVFTALYSSEQIFSDVHLIKDVASYLSKDNQHLYLLDGNRQVAVYDSRHHLVRTIPSHLQSPDSIAIGSQGSIYIADSNADQIRILSAKGEMLKAFSVYHPLSIAVLRNGNLVVASPSDGWLLHLYDSSGRELNRFGRIKQFDAYDTMQNLFLNRGKVLVDSSDMIYYVYQYAPLPTVQRFSPQGNLLSEFAIIGKAIDLQLEVAQEFLRNRPVTKVGGISVVNFASIDPETKHLWVGMNGASNSGIIYEYNFNGKKLREYGLLVDSLALSSKTLTGVNQIVVKAPSIYVFTWYGTFRFDLDHNVMPADDQFHVEATCPAAVEFNECKTPCGTADIGDDKDCKTELLGSVNTSGRRIISTVCNTDSTSCTAQIVLCKESNGVQTTHNISLNCGGGSGGGGGGELGGGGCDFQCPPFDPDLPPPNVCCFSPILIDVLANGFSLTDNPGGVAFDLNRDGTPDHLSWTSAGSDDAWLALDRNGNGRIDDGAELFGNFTPQPRTENANGFLALAEYDKPENGGNLDGRIDRRDAIFSSLRLWQDVNHNGISEPRELHKLSALNVLAIGLEYQQSRRRDQYGNRFGYRAKVYDAHGADVGQWAWDVFLVPER